MGDLGPDGVHPRGSCVAQALDFRSGHDLMICEIEPRAGLLADSMEPAWDSPSLSAPSPSTLTLPLSLSLSLSQNKLLK